ncbi:MAG: MATE family efflux transporter [Deferribacteraceae bacterium]|jgi:putative MATE family efflux protein|nr:MATE family efflux transporter [Deferribacteraceae bacterium]
MFRYKKFIEQSWSITWPMLIIMFFDFVMNMTDVYIAGLLGKEVQAALGMANQTYYILTVVANALTIGTIAVISRIFGSAERDKELPSAIHTSVLIAGACFIVMTIIGVTLAPAFIANMDIEESVKANAVDFMRIYCIGMFFHYMMIHFNGIMRACKLMRVSMKILMVASLTNVALNIIFVFYTPLGKDGIPLSTAICWTGACLFALRIIRNLAKGEKKFSKELGKKLFNISWPSGVVAFSWQFSSLVLYTIVGMLPVNSVETMAAMTAGIRIESIIFMPAFAFNMANAVLVGNLLGEKKPDDAYTIGLVTGAIGVSTIIVLTIAVLAGAEPIANLIASRDAMGNIDPLVHKEIIRYLYIVMLSEPFVAANLMFSGALAGAGDTRSLMKYTVFSLWIVRMPVAYIFGVVLGFGAPAIWWAMNITFFCQVTLSGRRYLSKKWMN